VQSSGEVALQIPAEGMSVDEYTEMLRSAGYNTDEITASNELSPVLVALAVVVIIGLAVLNFAKEPEQDPLKMRKKTTLSLYEKWGADTPSPSDGKSEVEPEKGDANQAREKLRRARTARRELDCRDFWPVDRVGRTLVKFNDDYQLMNHIIMASDRVRVEAYRAALERTATERKVLDVGGGAFCLLSRLALRANAGSVDCVEQNRGAVQHAIGVFKSEARGVECEGLREVGAGLVDSFSHVDCEDQPERPGNPQLSLSLRAGQHPCERELQLFQGLSSDVHLSGGYSLVVQEILGHIASSEGVVGAILNLYERGLVLPDCVFVPRRATTLFAPTEQIELTLAEQTLSLQYGSEISNLKCLTKYHAVRFSEQSFLATPVAFEDLNFGPDLQAKQLRDVEFITQRDGVFDGFHFHMLVDMDGERCINTLHDECSWHTTYVRMMDPGMFLPAGSRIRCKTCVELTQEEPQYSFEVIVGNAQAESVVGSFSWSGST